MMRLIENSLETVSVSPHLRQRFIAWSLAVAGSLTSSGLVALRPASAWAQDETTKNQKEDAQGGASAAVPEDKPFSRTVFNEMVTAGKHDELAEKLDAAMASEPDNATYVSLNATLSMYLARSNPPLAQARLKKQVENLLGRDELNATLQSALVASVSYLVQLDKELDAEKKLATLDQAINKLMHQGPNDISPFVRSLVSVKGRLLVAENRAAEAKAQLDGLLATLRESAEKRESSNDANGFVGLATTYAQILSAEFPDATDAVLSEAEVLVSRVLESAEATAADFSGLYNLKSSVISGLVYSDPKKADAMLRSVEEKLEALRTKLGEEKAAGLATYERSITSLRSRLKSALEREELIGTRAPEIDAEHFVATEAVSMDDLKGKVVLLDFWAVWCGPCIATFPHLIEWHEQYADKGLVILGATKFYNYAWDDETGKAKKSADEVDPELELAMLEKFREAHGLRHGFFVSGKSSDFSKQFLVTGIPQAVLIDQEGKIQMIRVGSGEANAKALHDKIAELLD